MFPQGTTSKDIDNQFPNGLREQAEDELDIRYRLVAETMDGEVLYEESFINLSDVQTYGFQAADQSVEKSVQSRMDLIEYDHEV